MTTTATAMNAALRQRLEQERVPPEDVEVLTTGFPSAPADDFVGGLHAAAHLLGDSGALVDVAALTAPWRDVCATLQGRNGTDPNTALIAGIAAYRDDVQAALINALGAVAAHAGQAAAQPRPGRGNPTPTRAGAATAAARYLQPVDPAFTRDLLHELERGSGVLEQRRARAGELLVDWLAAHGRLVRVPVTGERFYLYRGDHKLFNVSSDSWLAWLFSLTGVNPASAHFPFLAQCCKAASFEGEPVEMCRVAHWDDATQTLRVSRFDGTVYRLDGTGIVEEYNGDGPIIFDDHPSWTPYAPDYGAPGADTDALAWWVGLLNTTGDTALKRAQAELSLKAWMLSLFLTELCPTRPILVLQGEAGSGKSMLLRVLLRLLHGPAGQIAGIPDKPDGFTALAAGEHVLVLDNLDDPIDWLRDKLARISTGGVDHYRKLYTNNELGTVVYRCWVAVTSRTPDTLRREDIADRLLLLLVERVEEMDRRREGRFLLDSLRRRNRWWGDVLTALNRVVGVVRAGGVPEHSVVRMADFETVARTIARAEGSEAEATWQRVVRAWQEETAGFLLEDNVIAEALDSWLQKQGNYGRRLLTRDLYDELTLVLFPDGHPDKSWPRSAKSFGRFMAGLVRSLKTRYAIEVEREGWRTYYTFSLLSPATI